MRKPDFFIVGGLRCGTTAMEQYLARHPDLFMAVPKDPHFFDTDFSWPRRPLSMQQYLERFTGAADRQTVGEANSTYLYSKQAAQRVQGFQPAAKIIVMVRNPLDLLYSWYGWMRFHHVEPIDDFGAALDAEAVRKLGRNLPESEYTPAVFFYRDMARLSEQVGRYLDLFGAEQVRVIVYDDFRQRLPDLYRDTLAFLGVDPAFRPDFPVVNQNRVPRIKLFNRVLNDPPEVLRKIVTRALPDLEKRRATVRRLRRLNKNYKPRPVIEEELRVRLVTELAPEVRRLGDLIGRDLSHWSQT